MNRQKIQFLIEFISELTAILLANIITFCVFSSLNKIIEYPVESWASYGVICAFAFTAVFFSFSKRLNLDIRNRFKEFARTFRNCSLTYANIAILLILTKNSIIDSRYQFLGSFGLYLFFSLIFRYVAKKVMLKRINDKKLGVFCGVISTYDRAVDFIPKLQEDWSKNIIGVAVLDAELENDQYYYSCQKDLFSPVEKKLIDNIEGISITANKENLLGWIRTAALDEVFINIPGRISNEIKEIAEEIEDMGITVNINIDTLRDLINESKFSNLDCIVQADYPMAVLTPAKQSFEALIIKRMIDFIGGLLGSIISLPIILITAIPLLIESPGPLIFKQQRVGKNGRLFNIYKLRSMYVDAEERKAALMEQNKMEGHMFKMDDDPRITKVGKFIRKYSIDELPQFWNVLLGDMSLVGTRPPTVDEFEKYESHHKRRLSMKPGITGMWQVSGRSNIKDFEEVVSLDCEFIDNWSLILDFKILAKTVKVLLTQNGAE